MEKTITEIQYQLYLKLMKLDESKMHQDQKRETKRAFYGGFGQAFILFAEMGESMKSPDDFKDEISNILNSVQQFFNEEIKKNGDGKY